MKLGSIQFLRAIAATLVVYAHSIDLTQRFAKPSQGSFYYLSDLGCIGVDLFFVISGFIITYVAGQYTGIHRGLQFLQKRFFRINPIYYIASAVFLGVAVLELWLTQAKFAFPGKHYLSASVDTFFIVPLANNPVLYGPILLIGWTLAFEWLFYLLFFFTILAKVKRKIFLLSGLIVILVSLKYLLPYSGLRQAFLTNPIMLEFLLGVIICQLYLQVKKIPVYLSVVLLSLGVAWYIILIFYNNPAIGAIQPILTGGLSMERFLYWGIPSGFIAAGCVFLEKNGYLNKIWDNRYARLLGDASYSIYLVHMSVFVLIGIVYKKFSVMPLPDLSIFVQVAIALFVSVFFYRWIEKPLLRWLQEPTTQPVTNTPLAETPIPAAT